jgi:hypothetical protein
MIKIANDIIHEIIKKKVTKSNPLSLVELYILLSNFA